MLFTHPVRSSCVLFSLVEFGSSEKFEIYLFLQNVRTKMNDILWMIVDMFHDLTLLRM